jgi:hypothetical protein
MAKRRPPKSFTLTPQEDLFSPGGPEILKVNFLDTGSELTANLRATYCPETRRGVPGTLAEQHRWESLVRDALIRSVDVGAVKAEIHVVGGPQWFYQLLQRCGFKFYAHSAIYMYADLR